MLTLNVGGRQIACKIGLSSMWNIYLSASQCELSERTDRASCCSLVDLFIYLFITNSFVTRVYMLLYPGTGRELSFLGLYSGFSHRFLFSWIPLLQCLCSVQEGSFLAEELAVPMLCVQALSEMLCFRMETALSWHKSLRLTSIQSIVPLRILKVMFEMLICPNSLNYDKVMTVVRMRFPDPYVVKARYLCCVDVVPSLSLSPRTQTGTSMTTG